MATPVRIIGDICDQAAVHGVKTVSTTAAELFAGASRLSGRKKMLVTNEGATSIYYGIGNNTVTAGNTGTGQPIAAGANLAFYFQPMTDVPIYFIAGSANANVKVSEI